MKAILIIDTMPECCYDCKYCKFTGGYIGGYYGRSCLLTGEDVQSNNFDITRLRHKTCPLKPLPEKKKEIAFEETIRSERFDRSVIILDKAMELIKAKAYNKSLEDILGEE